MSSQPAGTSEAVVAFFAVIVLIMARRIYRSYTGVKVTSTRTIGWTVFYFLFSGFFLATSFAEGVPVYYGLLDAVVLAAGAFGSYRLSATRLTFWKSPDGGVYYKGGIAIYLIYVVGLVIRLGIEFVLIGPSAFTFTPLTIMNQGSILGLALADLLFTFGFGLLVGRNIRVYSDFGLIARGKMEIPSSRP